MIFIQIWCSLYLQILKQGKFLSLNRAVFCPAHVQVPHERGVPPHCLSPLSLMTLGELGSPLNKRPSPLGALLAPPNRKMGCFSQHVSSRNSPKLFASHYPPQHGAIYMPQAHHHNQNFQPKGPLVDCTETGPVLYLASELRHSCITLVDKLLYQSVFSLIPIQLSWFCILPDQHRHVHGQCTLGHNWPTIQSLV